MDKTVSDKGQAHGRWLVKAWWWCDPCQVTTLHLSDGPADGYDGADWVWGWFCQDCGGFEVRILGPLPGDAGPPAGPDTGDDLPGAPGCLWALESAKYESACLWLQGFLDDRVLPARYVVARAWRVGVHERLLRRVKAALGIRSNRWRDRWWWVPPWVPWRMARDAGQEGDARGGTALLTDSLTVALDEDGLPC